MDEVAQAVPVILEGCPDVQYFAKKRPEVLIKSWTDFVKAGFARQYAAYENGQPVGLMLGIIMPDLLAGEKQALECVWQVLPEYRKTGAGPVLMKMFESDAKKEKCVRMVFGAALYWNLEAMKRLYRKLGYTPISLTMEKRLCLEE